MTLHLVNFSCISVAVPVYFAKNATQDGCVTISSQIWTANVTKNTQKSIMMGLPQLEETNISQTLHPQSFRTCLLKPGGLFDPIYNKSIHWK